jgi:hypothetical protein
LLLLGSRLCSTKKRFEKLAEAAAAKNSSQIVELHIDAAPSRWGRELSAILPVSSKLIVTLALFGI